MPSIVTLAMSPSLDVFAEVDSLQADRKLRVAERRLYPGGGGINVARAIRRQGGSAYALFPAGGSNGEKISSLLVDEGIAHTRIPAEEEVRENFLVHASSSGEMYHFVMPGSPVTPAEGERCTTILDSLAPAPDYLVVSGSVPPGLEEDFYRTLARRARDQNTRLILDTAGAGLRIALDEPVYLIKPNQYEFAQLTGEEPASDTRACIEQARKFLARTRVEVLVLTLGRKGALLVTADQQIRVRPPEIDGISSVGAGDSFVGVMTLSLSRGQGLREALCRASAASAAVVETSGTELFHSEAVDRIHDRIMAEPGAIEIHESG